MKTSIKNKIVDEIIIKRAMARGILVIDENLESLTRELQQRNIRTIIPNKGMKDKIIKEQLLPHRIFVTNNTKDFKNDATSFEYGIISTEGMKIKNPNILAKKISDAIIEFSLWSRKYGFLLKLKDKGKSIFEELKQ